MKVPNWISSVDDLCAYAYEDGYAAALQHLLEDFGDSLPLQIAEWIEIQEAK